MLVERLFVGAYEITEREVIRAWEGGEGTEDAFTDADASTPSNRSCPPYHAALHKQRLPSIGAIAVHTRSAL